MTVPLKCFRLCLVENIYSPTCKLRARRQSVGVILWRRDPGHIKLCRWRETKLASVYDSWLLIKMRFFFFCLFFYVRRLCITTRCIHGCFLTVGYAQWSWICARYSTGTSDSCCLHAEVYCKEQRITFTRVILFKSFFGGTFLVFLKFFILIKIRASLQFKWHPLLSKNTFFFYSCYAAIFRASTFCKH